MPQILSAKHYYTRRATDGKMPLMYVVDAAGKSR
jgi:hypothetical protein